MRSACFCLFILVTFNQLTSAQESVTEWKHAKAGHNAAAKPTTGSPAEDNYDVKYVKLNLTLDNKSIYTRGDVITNAIALTPSFNAYVFELDSALVIDTVMIDGILRPVSNSGDVHTVLLPVPLPAGTMFSAHVFYHGIAAGSLSIFGGVKGMNNAVSPSWGTRITFTQSESYHAKEWWPCKQSLHDKIDSVDMWVTVPDSMKAGSNGVLQAVTVIDATHKRYEWKERHPIDYYLVSVAVAPYIDYSYFMHFSGSEDSMLVQNYIYPNPLTLAAFKNVIDSTGMIIDYFSKIYSRYPFWNEKYGHCMAPLNGGMENQTMTTIGFFDAWVVAHELSHQWFGDNVTCGTWSDIFVNEGVASYSEDLFREHFRGHANMINDMITKQEDVKSNDSGSIFTPDTTDESRVFDSRISYHKGACMLHMLRFVINNDSTFFQIYKAYQQEFKEGNGTIEGFKNSAKGIMGLYANGSNLDTFFKQWAYGEGFPKYTVKWNKSGNDVYVQLDQTTTVPGSVAFFTTPIEIQLHASTGDTVIRVINDRPGQLYHFTWAKAMNSIVLDPNSWLLFDQVSITHDIHLAVPGLSVNNISIYPNPAKENWQVNALPENSTLVLTDITGRIMWQTNTQSTKVTVPANGLAAGLYLLHISSEGVNETYKVVKE